MDDELLDLLIPTTRLTAQAKPRTLSRLDDIYAIAPIFSCSIATRIPAAATSLAATAGITTAIGAQVPGISSGMLGQVVQADFRQDAIGDRRVTPEGDLRIIEGET